MLETMEMEKKDTLHSSGNFMSIIINIIIIIKIIIQLFSQDYTENPNYQERWVVAPDNG